MSMSVSGPERPFTISVPPCRHLRPSCNVVLQEYGATWPQALYLGSQQREHPVTPSQPSIPAAVSAAQLAAIYAQARRASLGFGLRPSDQASRRQG